MATQVRDLRKKLGKTVRQARRVAEVGARKVLEELGVHHHEPYDSMSPEQRALRNRLRAHGRQLGDRRDRKKGTQMIDRLVRECAYEHWHRMLFARFLVESDLLIEPQSGVAISLDECQELARQKGTDWLTLASDYAERMLPQIFRKNDPVLGFALPPETISELEDLLKSLSKDVFTADDSLGWVYQFWQADKKDEINKSEKKIGADELPAVTQLFTEDYMVLFLLHNTLGAWWAGKILADNPELALSAQSEDELRAACKVGDVEWTYLRFIQNEGEDGSKGPWRPAAGTFEGWPRKAKNITVLDPCMGSGHFLVFALPILAAFRMAEERLEETAAVEAVLRDNLFGLEIDQRCTQIAAFNLAFAAWRKIGYRALPPLNLACSGLAIGVTKEEWLKLAEKVVTAVDPEAKHDLFGVEKNLLTLGLEERVKNGFEALYDLFAKAPWLGSLIEPRRAGADIFREGFEKLEPLFAAILRAADTNETREMAVTTQGMGQAVAILTSWYSLTITNVPYLKAGNHSSIIKNYCEQTYPEAKYDLATVFIDRIRRFGTSGQASAIITQQYWLFLKYYEAFRKKYLDSLSMNCLAILGPGAFDAISGEIVNICLQIATNEKSNCDHKFIGLDVSSSPAPLGKATLLRSNELVERNQQSNLNNPDKRISLDDLSGTGIPSISNFADFGKGSVSGDGPHYIRKFWELPKLGLLGKPWLNSPIANQTWSGREHIILWGDELFNPEKEIGFAHRGQRVFGKRGIAIGKAGQLRFCHYTGELFDDNLAVLYPKDPSDLTGFWAYCLSGEFVANVRKLDKKISVTAGTFVKIPYNRLKWSCEASSKDNSPIVNTTTQWLFDGRPERSDWPLQVSVARFIGYCWPRQTGTSFTDCPTLEPDNLESHIDADGIVCLNAIKGEPPAEQRLNLLLADAFGSDWSAAKLASLLAEAGFAGKTLDDWLRDGFFAQHCDLFHQRPFVWHIWDGRRDGFHALVNYHRLAAPNGEGRRTLESLIYSYLGDWIDRQRVDQRDGMEGADARLAHAEHLRAELIKILEGEPPYDIFVRWKPLYQQPIGWEPDVNDGVRLNIRPFMTARPLGARAKNACILRTTPKIKWQKNRGEELMRDKEDYPWFWGWDEATSDFTGGTEFDSNRWNDLHYSNSFTQAARARQKARLEGKA